jgi:hypothetical protein
VLEYHANAPLLWLGVGDVLVVNRDVTVIGPGQSGNGAQNGGLSTPGRADQHTNAALLDVQVYVLENHCPAETLGQTTQCDKAHAVLLRDVTQMTIDVATKTTRK